MKKLFLALGVAVVSTTCFAQGINRSEVDDFTGKKVVYTTWDQLKSSGLSCKNVILFKFRYEHDKQIMQLNWVCDEINSVHEGAEKVMFKLKDGVVKLDNVTYSMASKGGAATNVTCKDAYGVALTLTAEDLSALGDKANPIEKVRIYASNGYVDIDIKEKDAAKVPALYKMFIDEVNGVTNSAKSLKREKMSW